MLSSNENIVALTYFIGSRFVCNLSCDHISAGWEDALRKTRIWLYNNASCYCFLLHTDDPTVRGQCLNIVYCIMLHIHWFILHTNNIVCCFLSNVQRKRSDHHKPLDSQVCTELHPVLMYHNDFYISVGFYYIASKFCFQTLVPHPLNDPTEFGSLGDLHGISRKEG